MLVDRNDLIAEVKRRSDSAGLSFSETVIKFIIESEHEIIKECLSNGDEISFNGIFSAKAKVRGYNDKGGRGYQRTMKIAANIDSAFKSELMFKKNIVNDTSVTRVEEGEDDY